MSWSFSVNEANKENAVREFDNKLAEQEAHIPNAVSNALHNAAKELLFDAKSAQPCVVSTNGHFDADGSGNVSISVFIKKAVEAPFPGQTFAADTKSKVEASDGGRLG